MKKLMDVLPLLLVVVLLFGTACQSNKKKDAESVNVTLFDKDLPEIKTLVNGEWELVSGKNAREFCEYENTFIKFADDQYVWTEDGKAEPGALKVQVGAGNIRTSGNEPPLSYLSGSTDFGVREGRGRADPVKCFIRGDTFHVSGGRRYIYFRLNDER